MLCSGGLKAHVYSIDRCRETIKSAQALCVFSIDDERFVFSIGDKCFCFYIFTFWHLSTLSLIDTVHWQSKGFSGFTCANVYLHKLLFQVITGVIPHWLPIAASPQHVPHNRHLSLLYSFIVDTNYDVVCWYWSRYGLQHWRRRDILWYNSQSYTRPPQYIVKNFTKSTRMRGHLFGLIGVSYS